MAGGSRAAGGGDGVGVLVAGGVAGVEAGDGGVGCEDGEWAVSWGGGGAVVEGRRDGRCFGDGRVKRRADLWEFSGAKGEEVRSGEGEEELMCDVRGSLCLLDDLARGGAGDRGRFCGVGDVQRCWAWDKREATGCEDGVQGVGVGWISGSCLQSGSRICCYVLFVACSSQSRIDSGYRYMIIRELSWGNFVDSDLEVNKLLPSEESILALVRDISELSNGELANSGLLKGGLTHSEFSNGELANSELLKGGLTHSELSNGELANSWLNNSG
ncbi:hypothetical protein Tco_1147869, partial [Tanacetum coccineum]